jgi:hypothetical protein
LLTFDQMKILRPISALLLALLVLMSSTSFLVGMHFCKGEVKSISIFILAEKCMKHERPVPPCHKHMQANCCQDRVVLHDGDDFKNSFTKFEITAGSDFQIVMPLVLISEVIPSSHTALKFSPGYDPPQSHSDHTIALQVFRI